MSYGCCIPIPRRRINDEHDHLKVKVIIELAPAPNKEKGSKKFWKREIREKVLEKCKQLDYDLSKELEVNLSKVEDHGDSHYDDHLTVEPARPPRGIKSDGRERASSYASGSSSRRSSEEFPEAIGSKEYKLLTNQVTELEEKFRKAMITAAQLDNEKQCLTYQVDTLKDELEEIEESYLSVSKDYKGLSRAHELLDRDFKELTGQNELLKESVKLRDELIAEHGLVLVGGEEEEIVDTDDEDDGKKKSESEKQKKIAKMALVSQAGAEILKNAGSGNLDVRLKRLAEEKQELLDEIYRLRLDLEEEKQKAYKLDQLALVRGGPNGPEMKLMEVQRDANKQVSDYKFRLKRSQQEVTTLQSSMARLEGQLARFKAQAELSENVEDDLKAEKRKLLRELRDAQARIEELETANTHLQKRIDKLKTVKNALIKA